MSLTAHPPFPAIGDPNFNALAYAWAVFMAGTGQDELDALAIAADADAAAAAASAVAADVSADAAALSAAAADASAAAAASISGAIAFVPSQTYTLNQATISGVDSQTYRHITAASSLATDPSADQTNWTMISGNVSATGTQALTNKTIHGDVNTITVDGSNAVGFRTIPQNSKSTGYTAVLADSGKHILHPSADTTARTFTIPANASVAYPIGTAITFINQVSAGVLTIAITADTMRLAGAGTTGSRTLAANGIATAVKLTATEWIISGSGLT